VNWYINPNKYVTKAGLNHRAPWVVVEDSHTTSEHHARNSALQGLLPVWAGECYEQPKVVATEGLVREMDYPYLRWENEVGDRFRTSIEAHAGPHLVPAQLVALLQTDAILWEQYHDYERAGDLEYRKVHDKILTLRRARYRAYKEHFAALPERYGVDLAQAAELLAAEVFREL